MLYFVYTVRYGYEPCVFTKPGAALDHRQQLLSLAAYRDVPITVHSITEQALAELAEPLVL